MLREDLFEYLQVYGDILVVFTTDSAVWINLIFRLADFVNVSCFFDGTSRNGDAVS